MCQRNTNDIQAHSPWPLPESPLTQDAADCTHAYPLRPHHGLCLAFFMGKGYSNAFTLHMREMLDLLLENPMIILTLQTDEICRACPNQISRNQIPASERNAPQQPDARSHTTSARTPRQGRESRATAQCSPDKENKYGQDDESYTNVRRGPDEECYADVRRGPDEECYADVRCGPDEECYADVKCRPDSICVSAEKVQRYDLAVLRHCSLAPGRKLPFLEFARSVQEKIISAGIRAEICGNCQWNEICEAQQSRWTALSKYPPSADENTRLA